MMNRAKEFRIEPGDTGEHLRISFIVLVGTVPYQSEFSGIADQNTKSPCPKDLADPRGVGAGFYGHQYLLRKSKTIKEHVDPTDGVVDRSGL
jgi:hypothetical protein